MSFTHSRHGASPLFALGLTGGLLLALALLPAVAGGTRPAVQLPVDPPSIGNSVVLLLAEGEQQGSGVVLRRDGGAAWVVTNRHVLEGLKAVCVRSADGRLLPGIAVLPTGQASSLDLAFVWIPHGAEALPLARLDPQPARTDQPAPATAGAKPASSQAPAAVHGDAPPHQPVPVAASGSSGSTRADAFPIVRAAGYPVPDQQNAAPPQYRELPGLLLPLLTTPLQGGMQLAYTSPVRKGMSGGGLFDEAGRLIGINTTHPNPLWSDTLKLESGQPVAPRLNRQLELVALAIPIARVLPLLEGLKVPGGSGSNSARSAPRAAHAVHLQGAGTPQPQAGLSLTGTPGTFRQSTPKTAGWGLSPAAIRARAALPGVQICSGRLW